MRFKAFWSVLINLSLNIFFLLSIFTPIVQAQYSTSGSTTYTIGSCSLATNATQMTVNWTDPYTSNSYYEIWRTDGSIPTTGDGLKGSYYANANFSGSPILTRVDAQIKAPLTDWGTGSPDPAVSVDGDNFSIIWEGFVGVPENGSYIFYTDVNDGVQLYIDGGTPKINKLVNNDNTVTYQSGPINFTQGSRHAILLKYSERTGNAAITLSWSYGSTLKTPVPRNYLFSKFINHTVVYPSSPLSEKTTADGLRAHYFANKDLSGAPILNTLNSNVNFTTWGAGSPDPLVPADNFSVRWSGQVLIPNLAGATGDYTFYVEVNDGARLYIDGVLVIDKWGNRNNAAEFSSTPIKLAANTKRDIVLEYYENIGDASVVLSWKGPITNKQPIPAANLFSSPVDQDISGLQYNSSGGLQVSFYNTPDLTGQPALTRIEQNKNVDVSWGADSPDPLVLADNFSVRWSGQVQVPNVTDDYTFYVEVNDGARLYIDGVLVIDKWNNRSTAQEFFSTPIRMAANSRHSINLEYYDNTGNAEVYLKWGAPSLTKAPIPSNQLYAAQFSFVDNNTLQDNTFYSYSVMRYRIQGTTFIPWSSYEITPSCGAISINPNPAVVCTIDVSWTDNTGSSRFGVYRAEAIPSGGFGPDASGNLASGLLSYWGFNEQGNDVRDTRGLNNGVAFGTTSVNGFRSGLARKFNGTYDYIRIDSQGSNPNLSLTRNFTIAGWINPAATSGTKGIITKLVDDTNIQFALSVDAGSLQFNYEKNDNNFKVRGGTIKANNMQFVAVTVSNSATPTINIYVGDPSNPPANTGVAVETLTNINPMELGRWSNNTNSSFNGTMEEMGIWGRALTTQDLEDLYNGGLANPYTPTYSSPWSQIESNWPASPYSDTTAVAGKKYAYMVSAYDNLGGQIFSASTNPVNYLTQSCAPDLVSNISGLGYIANAGFPVNFSGEVQNIQRSGAIASLARFCVAPSTTSAATVNCANSTAYRVGGADVPTQALQFGQSSTLSSSPWTAVLGNHTVYMCVDVNKVTGETNLANNCSPYPFTVQNTKAWIQTTGGDVHTNSGINVSGPP